MSQMSGTSSITGLGSFVNQGTAIDSTPNSVDWANVEVTYPTAAETSNQTINGITTTIKVYVSIVDNVDGATLEYSKNNGSWTAIDYYVDGIYYNPSQISISNGDTLKFRATAPNSIGSVSIIEIKQNVSGGDVTLDTIQLTVLGDGGGGPA